jgi:hypothetical protein
MKITPVIRKIIVNLLNNKYTLVHLLASSNTELQECGQNYRSHGRSNELRVGLKLCWNRWKGLNNSEL